MNILRKLTPSGVAQAAPGRLAIALGAALALAITIAPAVTSLAPEANAVANRRICMYAADVPGQLTVPGSGQMEVRSYTGLNYKKDGACPRLNGQKMLYGINQSQPAPKFRCEDWPSRIRASGFLWGSYSATPEKTADPCTMMRKDTVIHFRVRTSDGVALVAYSGHYNDMR